MFKKAYNNLLTQLRSPEPEAVPWSGLALILNLIYLVTFFMSVFLLATLLDSSLETPEADVLLGASLLSGLLTIGFSFQYTSIAVQNARAEKKVTGDISLWRWLRLENSPDLVSGALVGFALAVLIDTISLVLGVPADTLPLPLARVSENDSVLFSAAVFTFLVIRPIAAGLVFQGIWYPALLKYMPVYYAIGVSSLLYAVSQYLIDPQYLWWGLITPFWAALVAGIARAATKSTQMAIIMHMMFSLFVILRAILN